MCCVTGHLRIAKKMLPLEGGKTLVRLQCVKITLYYVRYYNISF